MIEIVKVLPFSLLAGLGFYFALATLAPARTAEKMRSQAATAYAASAIFAFFMGVIMYGG